MLQRFVVIRDIGTGRDYVCRLTASGEVADFELIQFGRTHLVDIFYDTETREFGYKIASPATMERLPEPGTVIVGSIARDLTPEGHPFLMNWGYADQYDAAAASARQETPLTGFPLWSLLMQLHAIDTMKAVRIARAFVKLDDGEPLTEDMHIAIGEARVYLYNSNYFPWCALCMNRVFPANVGHAEHAEDLQQDEPRCYNCYDHPGGCEECNPDSICTTCYRWSNQLQDGVCEECIKHPGECTNCRGDNGVGCPVCRPWRWLWTQFTDSFRYGWPM